MPRPPTFKFNDIPVCLEKFRYLCQFHTTREKVESLITLLYDDLKSDWQTDQDSQVPLEISDAITETEEIQTHDAITETDEIQDNYIDHIILSSK